MSPIKPTQTPDCFCLPVTTTLEWCRRLTPGGVYIRTKLATIGPHQSATPRGSAPLAWERGLLRPTQQAVWYSFTGRMVDPMELSSGPTSSRPWVRTDRQCRCTREHVVGLDDVLPDSFLAPNNYQVTQPPIDVAVAQYPLQVGTPLIKLLSDFLREIVD